MNVKQALSTLATVAALAVAAGVGSLMGVARAQADEDQAPSRVRRGLEIAPVPLNLRGKDPELVGLGSYLVNAVASCNMCHSAGTATEYTAGGNPYFKGNEPTVVNQATYLGGGRVFAAQVAGATPPIVSRNLTPDRTGRPVGGRTFEEFRLILQTGADLDLVHPNCSDPTVIASSTCFPVKYPYDGDKLQVMPWPELHHLSEHDMRAIYEYLKAIPCVAGPASGVLHNDCT
jgi:hypothetical protein